MRSVFLIGLLMCGPYPEPDGIPIPTSPALRSPMPTFKLTFTTEHVTHVPAKDAEEAARKAKTMCEIAHNKGALMRMHKIEEVVASEPQSDRRA